MAMTMVTTKKLRWSCVISLLFLVTHLTIVQSRRAVKEHTHFVSSENLDLHHEHHEKQEDEQEQEHRGSGRDIVAVKTGACKMEQNILIDIIVKEMHNSSFLSSCHDPRHSATLYTTSKIDGPALSEDHCTHGACPRSKGFDPAGFYPDFDIKTSFKRTEQQKTLETLLGREAATYFHPEKNFYLARGHLTPNADGSRNYERKATFFYINTVPQWQVINEGNWKNLEDNARAYAKENRVVLSIWTGADGVLTLKDSEGKEHEIYLAKTKDGQIVPGKLPVPRLMWKVVHDPRSNSGVAIIMLNDPFPRNHRESDKTICTSVCSQVELVDWKINNGVRGFTICCTIKDFLKAFPFVEELKNLTEIPLLQNH